MTPLKTPLKAGAVYTVKIKTAEEIRKIEGAIVASNYITVGNSTGYSVLSYLGKVIVARYNGNSWLGEDFFNIPAECVESVYVPRKKV